MLKILEDVKEEDHFNIVLFGSDVEKWKDTLIQATPENLDEARRYVQSIDTRGGKLQEEWGFIYLFNKCNIPPFPLKNFRAACS